MTPLPLVPTDCHDCGACCLNPCSPPSLWPMLSAPDCPTWAHDTSDGRLWHAMPADVKATLEAYYRTLDGDDPPSRRDGDGQGCLWYDRGNRRCLHYQWRPSACREFEVGSADCLECRSGYKIGETPQ